ncbi:hypothetical protein AQ490_07460 [Wenjunlia vitaminophila]|uniref:DUF2029 domain-containing protein n=1 Tax=Wenjunlia vitaminophila TaxID=76728 RepID=A0A0T6LMR2_WENVI|nr:glycosyltransferase 87 family protein [Wenjunlia vitaminophila]KRV47301.1 hypothetical protein AQ490_07460 [Wenjunlia vitaminophila]
MTSQRDDRSGDLLVSPTTEDAVAASGSELIGGPPGRRAALGVSWWTPVRVLAVVMVVMFALGMVQKYPCYDGDWFFGANAQYTHACYSDIPHLYQGRGFADGLHPYFDKIPPELSNGMDHLEYPVLTGGLMQLAAWLTPDDGDLQDEARMFWFVNASLLMVLAVVAVVAVARTHRRRPWDALLVALAPGMALTGTINWDMLAVALTALAMCLWSRSRPGWAGVLLGLATAAKLYPVLLFGPLLLLCLRANRLRAFGTAFGGAVAAWLLVNLPVMIPATDGWSKFYTFSQERGEDYGTFWLILMQQRHEALDHLNAYASAAMLLACAGIAVLALYAPRRPRFAQLAFLVVAAFALTNKVYSPQYVLWLIPLAALARPRWRDFLIWQVAEAAYFLGVWMYLADTVSEKGRGLTEGGYHLAIAVHLLGTLWFCALVVRDVLVPECDPVRADGSDDPSGGVLDGAPDAFALRSVDRSPGGGALPPLAGPPVPQVHWGTTAPPSSPPPPPSAPPRD